MRIQGISGAALLLAGLAAGPTLRAEEAAPPASAAPADTAEVASKAPVRFRPIESNVIINLPSVEVPTEGTLTFLVTHRFTQRIQDGSLENFFTLDNGNEWGFGLWYAPIKNLNAGFYRTSQLGTYEASAQYELPRAGGFDASLRVGEDWRTYSSAASPKSSFFTQAVLAYSIGPYARITAVPTYLQRTNGFVRPTQPPPPGDKSCTEIPDSDSFNCSGLYENVFNVPVGVSIAITHSITIHGEVTPRLAKVNPSGVGWCVTVEKSLLRHRFAFFAGNQRATTVNQYTGGIPMSRSPSSVYIGFNLFRAWKLN
jgi:hypothetical protein